MTGLISVDQALSLIAANRPSRSIESIALEKALGRRLASPIIAQRTHPPASVSAMDGYAVKLSDVRNKEARLRLVGEAQAGNPFPGTVESGQAVRIFTGSVIPNGADHVVIQEEAERSESVVLCRNAYSQAKHIRRAGIDFSKGDVLVEAGTLLTPSDLAIAAASNNAELRVEKRLKVGLIANGDELKPPGSDLAPGQIINSNPYGLMGLIEAWGGEAVDLGIASDSVDAIHARMDQEDDIDIFVPIGGASVGDHDHMRNAFRVREFDPVFEKIAVRPGKPTWFSKSEAALVLGLPGNPASALVCAHLFLARLLGADLSQRSFAGQPLDPLPANGPREHFMRAHARISENGQIELRPAASQDSSLLRPFLACNALIRRSPDAAAVNAGGVVEAIAIKPLL